MILMNSVYPLAKFDTHSTFTYPLMYHRFEELTIDFNFEKTVKL